MKTALKIVGALAGVFALVFGFFFVKALADPHADERMRARDAIELCRKEQSRSSLGDLERRFVASTCETMERDFTAKFGGRP